MVKEIEVEFAELSAELANAQTEVLYAQFAFDNAKRAHNEAWLEFTDATYAYSVAKHDAETLQTKLQQVREKMLTGETEA